MTDPICYPAGPGARTEPQCMREQLIETAEEAIDNVHDMDVTHHDYAVSVADAVLELLKGVIAERDALRDQLAAARNEALDEAAALFDEEAAHDRSGLEYSSLVGIPISNAESLRKSAERAEQDALRIRALKSTTPAPREVTPQEAARVLLDHYGYVWPNAACDAISANQCENPAYQLMTALRALANEEQGDE